MTRARARSSSTSRDAGKKPRSAGANASVSLKLGHSRRTTESYREWRTHCLRRAGFDAATADRIATDTAFDLHALLELVDRGCPPQLAMRILAPLDEVTA